MSDTGVVSGGVEGVVPVHPRLTQMLPPSPPTITIINVWMDHRSRQGEVNIVDIPLRISLIFRENLLALTVLMASTDCKK